MDLPKTTSNGHETLKAVPTASILKVIWENERFLVCSHARPDGTDLEELRLALTGMAAEPS